MLPAPSDLQAHNLLKTRLYSAGDKGVLSLSPSSQVNKKTKQNRPLRQGLSYLHAVVEENKPSFIHVDLSPSSCPCLSFPLCETETGPSCSGSLTSMALGTRF